MTQVDLCFGFFALALESFDLKLFDFAYGGVIFFATIQMVLGEYVSGYGFSLPNLVFIYVRVFSATA